MGDPKKQRKKFDTPRYRWRKDILQEELKLTWAIRFKKQT